MLCLTLAQGEYLTIGDKVVVQLDRISGDRCKLVIQAPKQVTVLRGAVLERSGGQRPACLAPPPKKKPRYYRDQVFRWNDDRERAVRAMKLVFDRLEENGSDEEAEALRKQLDRIIPAFWEDDLAAQ